ncbi:MAG TPA: hypothetical protein VK422_22965 [Pyrinomonadaceae bacterium]|nr:hypothetical protein [Pyrinomonadaceae bacterium]
MRFDQRIVSQMPLRELWNGRGVVSVKELRELNASDIAELLRGGKIHFVVADVGSPLTWVPVDECYDFWKSEVKSHLAVPDAENYLGNFPDEYCYFASEWESGMGGPIVLLAKSH